MLRDSVDYWRGAQKKECWDGLATPALWGGRRLPLPSIKEISLSGTFLTLSQDWGRWGYRAVASCGSWGGKWIKEEVRDPNSFLKFIGAELGVRYLNVQFCALTKPLPALDMISPQGGCGILARPIGPTWLGIPGRSLSRWGWGDDTESLTCENVPQFSSLAVQAFKNDKHIIKANDL